MCSLYFGLMVNLAVLADDRGHCRSVRLSRRTCPRLSPLAERVSPPRSCDRWVGRTFAPMLSGVPFFNYSNSFSKMLLLLPLLLFASLVEGWQPAVQTGLDVLVASNFSALDGKKVIILTNPTGVTASLDANVDVMVAAGVDLVGVMGPEHGFRGDAQAGSGSGGSFKDPQTGLTVYDAYNANYTELVGFITDSGADTVVFDIQDVGARFYTCEWPPEIARSRIFAPLLALRLTEWIATLTFPLPQTHGQCTIRSSHPHSAERLLSFLIAQTPSQV